MADPLYLSPMDKGQNVRYIITKANTKADEQL